MWTKVSDDFAEHPKIVALGNDAPDALAVWISGACFAARYRTDGVVPEGAVRAVGLTAERARAMAARLVEVGLWDHVASGFAVHNYQRYNITRAESVALSDKRAEAGRKGAESRWQPRVVGNEEAVGG